MNSAILQGFCAVFSGTAQAFAISNRFMPEGSPFLALFCLLPLYQAFYRSRSYRETFFLFAGQILTVHMISSYWLAHFHGFAVFTLGASALGTAVQGGMCGILMHAFVANSSSPFSATGGIKSSDILCRTKRIIWFCAGWVLYEYIKSTGSMGYPWGTVSMAAYKWKIFIQIADFTGIWGITFLLTLFSATAAELLDFSFQLEATENDTVAMRTCVKFTAVAFALTAAYGLIQFYLPREKVKSMNIAMVQQNIDPWEGGDAKSIEVSRRLTQEAMDSFKSRGLEPDLVVWSEGVITKKFPASRFYYETFPEEESLTQFISRMDVPFIIGGETTINSRRKKKCNSAILFDRNGKYSGFYSKTNLVPFAEKIPYSENPAMNYFMRNVIKLPPTLTPGFQYVIFRIPVKSGLFYPAPLDYKAEKFSFISLNENGLSDPATTEKYISGSGTDPDAFVSFSVPICFEDAFPSTCRTLYNLGSEIFLNITNDSWSKTECAEWQHFIVSSFRAIEFRTTLVRCTNSGYTAVVDPRGKILADLPLFEEASLAVTVPVYDRVQTTYSRYGDWFILLMAAIILGYLGFILFGKIRDMAR